MRSPVLLIHGGAWAMPDDAVAAHRRGIAAALRAGWRVLKRRGAATDAVVAAIRVMEDDDTFDAGRGSFLTRDARVQCDALLMAGDTLRAGGVACVERLRNPIAAAQLVLDRSPHVYFVGEGAEQFAAEHGMPLIANGELIVERERERLRAFHVREAAGGADTTFSGAGTSVSGAGAASSDAAFSGAGAALSGAAGALDAEVLAALPEAVQIADPVVGSRDMDSHDTVGAVAMDAEGRLAAGTSTGGTLSKAPGRVGDSSLIGCGCYADNEAAAVSLTGWGEPMMKLVLGKWAVDRVRAGDAPDAAAADAIAYLHRRLGGHGGVILLGPDGRVGVAHNTPRMAWGLRTAERDELGTEWTA